MDGEEEQPHYIEVRPLNPFQYPKSGHDAFPKTFRIELSPRRSFNATAHVWPPNSQEEHYKLGGKAAARQGFYFYRNDRLIQAGGWNGIVQNDSEPHSSLARVAVDLPESLDADFGLNVQKSSVIVPPTFLPAVAKARTDDDDSFDDFRAVSQRIYRGKDVRATKDHPLVPVEGLPKGLRERARNILAGKAPKVRGVDIVWGDLDDPTELVGIDLEERTIIFNKNWRRDLLGGRNARAGDLPVLKSLVFLLLRNEFEYSITSPAQRQRLLELNELLAAAVKFDRGNAA
jgi:hypothetical protein